MADWQRARLIPTSGIDSAREAESRTTSALLAVLSIVRPYSKVILDRLGASRAQNATVDTFIEVGFDWHGKRVRPDGVIRVAYGSGPPWAAIVEVKTGEDVRPLWTLRRQADGNKRVGELAAQLVDSGQLTGALRVPNTAGDLQLLADVKARQLVASIEVDAPQDRGARTRVRWLLDQLAEAPARTIVEAWPKQARAPIAVVTLGEARDDRMLLCPTAPERRGSGCCFVQRWECPAGAAASRLASSIACWG